MQNTRMRFGNFMAPVHPLGTNPTIAIERDLELVEFMDKLGYDEAWMGEHHAGGLEIIASPEVFLAAAAERTKNIKLGTGVCTVTYQHPLIVADRMNQLDHMTRGRTMFGMGPGALVADAYMQGIEAEELRERFPQAVDAISRLMKGEVVNMKTDWFECREARLHLGPYSDPHMELTVTNNVSPSGAKVAGRFGTSMLTLGATTHAGFNALAANWAIAEESAAEHGQVIDRSGWRLVGPMHIAETREQALEEVKYGIDDWIFNYSEIANIPIIEKGKPPVQALVENGMAVIGTPQDALDRMEQLIEKSGGFGAFLFMDHNWANWENKKKSYELFARHVIPHFRNMNQRRFASAEWVISNQEKFTASSRRAVGMQIKKHIDEKGANNVNPDILLMMQNHQAQSQPS